MMKTIFLKDSSMAEVQHYLQTAVAPRPICFASTIDKAGNINLSPFSFFNLFSYNPPVVVFSPVRRGRDNTTKHTLENIAEVPEVVINIVTYDMVQQMSLASCEFAKGVNEFEKAGFKMEAATMVKPPMVKQSKIKLECTVTEIKPLGEHRGAGNLIIATVQVVHIAEDILTSDGKIDQTKLQLVARLGGDWYCKVDESNLFKVEKPNTKLGIGIDALPNSIKNSSILTGNNLGQLANVSLLPLVDPAFYDDTLKNIIQYYAINPDEMENELHIYAAQLLNEGKVNEAWQVLLALN
jgi:flavin reductase (DIM6/NTAB) family NADH-FMN oxidoreductase RutF